MGKTPYELRYDLLAMAQAIITENLMNERIRLENDWYMKKEATLHRMGEGVYTQAEPFPDIPKINPDDVIAMANKLNAFVSKDS